MTKSLQTRLDEVSGHAASQNDELRSIRSLLRRRETQLEKANAEVRKLRRKLGLDDPFALMPLTSFVHEHLARLGMSDDYVDNRPRAVRCVHPIVTLLEKLDALSRRYNRDVVEADAFARHYEDAARIIAAPERLPRIETTALALAEDMLAERSIAALPSAGDPSLVLDDLQKRASVERAYAKIAPMFWGPRIPLDEACDTIRAWVGALRG